MPVFLHDGGVHVFHHIPKAAGTTVETWLQARFGVIGLYDPRHRDRPAFQRWSRTSPQHLLFEDFERLFPSALIASSFAVCRHPVERAISAYRNALTRGYLPRGPSLEDWLRHVLSNQDRYPYAFDNHLRPQKQFVGEDTIVFRLEDGMDAVFDWLENKFGDPATPIERVSANRAWTEQSDMQRVRLPPSSLRWMRDVYAADFERFGYDLDPDAEYFYLRAPRDVGLRGWLREGRYRGQVTLRQAIGRTERAIPRLRYWAASGEWG